ncbi:MAG: methylated-DNA--[protein]-cysteine S-methyltransferase [Planctomycetes bacterium]|nr:methylated-DNA--[protein]-cysteine S-methyltransferase [Planctomycetota bacterium]
MDVIQEYASPVGRLTLASDGKALIGIWLQGQKYFGHTLAAGARRRHLPLFSRTAAWLDTYFSGVMPGPFPVPLAPRGSPFRQAVWRLLSAIPAGTVTTYGALASDMARQLGRPSLSAQAVGGAVGHNPISIIIPCHRVVGAGGSLTGYAGGLAVKQALLELEGAPVASIA